MEPPIPRPLDPGGPFPGKCPPSHRQLLGQPATPPSAAPQTSLAKRKGKNNLIQKKTKRARVRAMAMAWARGLGHKGASIREHPT